MNLYRLSLDRSRKEGPRHTVIQSSESCKAEPEPPLCDECGDTLMGDEETLCTSCEEYARKAKP